MTQEPNIIATDDPEVAQAHGLTRLDEGDGRWYAEERAPLSEAEVVELYEAMPESLGEVTGHATGTVTPGEHASGDGDEEPTDDEQDEEPAGGEQDDESSDDDDEQPTED